MSVDAIFLVEISLCCHYCGRDICPLTYVLPKIFLANPKMFAKIVVTYGSLMTNCIWGNPPTPRVPARGHLGVFLSSISPRRNAELN
jgi:hypothetical protein